MRRFVLAIVMFGMASARRQPICPICRFFAAASPKGSRPPASTGRAVYVGGQVGYDSSNMDFTGSHLNMRPMLIIPTASCRTRLAMARCCGKAQRQRHRLRRRSSATTGSGTTSSSASRPITCIQVQRLRDRSMAGSSPTRRVSPPRHLRYARLRCAITDIDHAPRPRAARQSATSCPTCSAALRSAHGDITQRHQIVGQDDAAASGFRRSLPPFVSLAIADEQNNHFVYGYTAGLGVDIMLVGRPVHARANRNTSASRRRSTPAINTVRVGLGYKF